MDEGQVTPQKALCIFQLISALPCIGTSKVHYVVQQPASFAYHSKNSNNILHFAVVQCPLCFCLICHKISPILNSKTKNLDFPPKNPTQPAKTKGKNPSPDLAPHKKKKPSETACGSSVVDGLEIFHEGQPEDQAATMGCFLKWWYRGNPISHPQVLIIFSRKTHGFRVPAFFRKPPHGETSKVRVDERNFALIFNGFILPVFVESHGEEIEVFKQWLYLICSFFWDPLQKKNICAIEEKPPQSIPKSFESSISPVLTL